MTPALTRDGAHFRQAWSDPQLVQEAYPLREPMRAQGFRHVWLRCHLDRTRAQMKDDDIERLKVPELKQKLKAVGEKASGNKAELVARLKAAVSGAASPTTAAASTSA